MPGTFSQIYIQVVFAVKGRQNQEKHHKKKTFKEEYMEFLKKFGVQYEEKHLFEWYDK